MLRQIVTPPESRALEGPLVFLGGPIEGAADWQSAAANRLALLAPSVHVANPRRELGPGEELSREQMDWESSYLTRAAADGVILFWLAAEQKRVPWRAYAQTARAQLFEWKVRHELQNARLVVGIEEGFKGARYIHRRFEQDLLGFPIHATLEDCCVAAATLATGEAPRAGSRDGDRAPHDPARQGGGAVRACG